MIQKILEGDCIVKVLFCVGVVLCCEVECMIVDGCVKVNGKVIISLVFNVIDKDWIIVDDKFVLEFELVCFWLFYKFVGLVIMVKDEKDCQMVFDVLFEDMLCVMIVGWFDLNLEGLLLLINDGGLK